MNNQNLFPECSSSLWIQNLVHGLSGFSIKAKQCLFCESSPFQKVEVFDTYAFGRVLCLGGNIMLTENEDTYDEMMVHPAMFMHESPKAVCCIGGGDGGCLKELIKHPLVEKIVVVEIDQLVQETVHRYFPALGEGFKDHRVELIVDDGYTFLSNSDRLFDVIFVDSYDPGGPVQSLETSDFHQLVSQHLNPGGIVVFQTDSPIIRGYFLRSTMASIAPFFPYYKAYICSMVPFPGGICSFLVCTRHEKTLDLFHEKRYHSFATRDLTNYYNDNIHKGAFLLPQNIINIIR